MRGTSGGVFVYKEKRKLSNKIKNKMLYRTITKPIIYRPNPKPISAAKIKMSVISILSVKNVFI